MDDKELQQIREAIEKGDLTHDHVYKLLAELETLKYRFGNQEDALEAYRELCDQTEKLLPKLSAYMVIESKEYRELLDMYDIQKEPRKYGDGGRPQSAGAPAGNGDAGEAGGQ